MQRALILSLVILLAGCDTRSPQKINDDRQEYLTRWLRNFEIHPNNIDCISAPACIYRCTVGVNVDGNVKLYKVTCIDGYCASGEMDHGSCELETGDQ